MFPAIGPYSLYSKIVYRDVVVIEFEDLLNSLFTYIDNDYLLKPLNDYFENNWIVWFVDRRKITCRILTFSDIGVLEFL
jgi:hypothetical protein